MMPSVIYEKLANDTILTSLGITQDRVIESQSTDKRPFGDGYFITIAFEETDYRPVINRGPRSTTIAVHHPWDIDRDFAPITKILNRIDDILLPLENVSGDDGIVVSQIRFITRSGNRADDDYRTITRWATYGVSFDEHAA